MRLESLELWRLELQSEAYIHEKSVKRAEYNMPQYNMILMVRVIFTLQRCKEDSFASPTHVPGEHCVHVGKVSRIFLQVSEKIGCH